jgi:hypothetical protein
MLSRGAIRWRPAQLLDFKCVGFLEVLLCGREYLPLAGA